MRPGLSITLALLAAPAIAHAAGDHDDDVLARFAASRASLISYVGSGTFVSNPYSDDPLFSQALSLHPRFALSRELSAAAGFTLECEFTEPNNPNARRCAPGDLSLSLSAADLVRDPWLDGQVRGTFSILLPTSQESRWNHTVVNLRAGAGYGATFFDDHLSAGLSFGVQKYLHTQKTRGPLGSEPGGGDFPNFLVRRSATEDGSTGSGGRYNDNWAFISSANVGWKFTDELSAAVSFGLYNYLRYSAPDDIFADDSRPLAGRTDVTTGSLEVSWTPLAHFAVDLGVTSAQPALTADGKSLRFPFYDFISPSNNFTRWYLAVHLSY